MLHAAGGSVGRTRPRFVFLFTSPQRQRQRPREYGGSNVPVSHAFPFTRKTARCTTIWRAEDGAQKGAGVESASAFAVFTAVTRNPQGLWFVRRTSWSS